MQFEKAPIQNAYDALHRTMLPLLDSLRKRGSPADAIILCKAEDILLENVEVCRTCGHRFQETESRWRGECHGCVKDPTK